MTDTDTFRVRRRTAGYVHVPNDVVNADGALSYKALGLLVFMLGRPADWQFSRDRLSRGVELGAVEGTGRLRNAREGREAVATALQELTRAGYYRTRRYQGERGRWHTVTDVTDTPFTWPEDEA